MIIFDEKDYAQRIINSGHYQTLQHQGRERKALARYLKYDMGYNDYEIKQKVSEIKSKRKEKYDSDIWDATMNRVIETYDNADYIKDYKVGISQAEIDTILDQPTTELRNLLFVLTVYFKWARNTREYLCMRGTDTWVKEADLDCCKLAGLSKLRKAERIQLFNILYHKGVYKSDYIRKYHDIFTLPFIDDKTPVIVIQDFNEILAYLEQYLNPDSCTHCEVCGALIHKSAHNRVRCKWCNMNRKHKKGEQTNVCFTR